MAEAKKEVVTPSDQVPGAVVAPQGAQAPAQQPATDPKPQPNAVTTDNSQQLDPVSDKQFSNPPVTSNERSPATSANPEPGHTTATAADGTISWTASEFVAHQKTPGWYGLLALSTVILSGIIYFLTGDIISTSVVVIAALFFAIYGARQPRQLEYQLSSTGINIGGKQYHFEDFRSFTMVPEGAFSSVVFMPMKRFAPLRTIYYAPEDEDQIIGLLTERLPLEEHKADVVDGLMRRVRF